jgi:serine/threonine protein kinase
MAIDHPYDALPPGYRLGSYEILRVLGRGGFGITYQARRSGVAGDMVAIKELYPAASSRRTSDMTVVALPGTSQDEINDSIGMFIREAHLICRLDHPNIVRGVDAFEANGTGYLVMRYVTGRNLRDSLRDPTGFRPSPQSLPVLLSPLLDALDTLHRHELLHCDIKPDNIFLGVGYEPILIDLGSARWHVQGVGTEEASTYSHYFSAIEQVTESFGPIGPWTDIYQLSAVLYRCITGGKLPDALDRLDSPDDPFLPLSEIPEAVRDYPRPLIDAIDLGLRLHPKHRPRSVAEWRRPFESLLPPPSRKKRVTSPPSATQPPPSSLQTPPADRITPPHSPSSGSPPDLLLWLGGGLLIIILLIVFIIATQ